MKTDYEIEEKKNSKKPKANGLAIFGLVLFIIGICMFLSNFLITFATIGSSFEASRFGFVLFGILGGGGMLFMIVGGVLAAPLLTKAVAKYNKHIATYAKDDLSAIAETNAEIASKALTKSARAIKKGLEENQEDLEDLSELGGTIQSKGTKKVAKAAREGWEEGASTQKTKFCSSCGKKIKQNAKFCEHCGSEQ